MYWVDRPMRSLIGTRAPTLMRTCWRVLSATCIWGTTSQWVAAPLTSSRAATDSTMGAMVRR